jgi:hypothetical protein
MVEKFLTVVQMRDLRRVIAGDDETEGYSE